jgi:hypothetical protein
MYTTHVQVDRLHVGALSKALRRDQELRRLAGADAPDDEVRRGRLQLEPAGDLVCDRSGSGRDIETTRNRGQRIGRRVEALHVRAEPLQSVGHGAMMVSSAWTVNTLAARQPDIGI